LLRGPLLVRLVAVVRVPDRVGRHAAGTGSGADPGHLEPRRREARRARPVLGAGDPEHDPRPPRPPPTVVGVRRLRDVEPRQGALPGGRVVSARTAGTAV